MSTPAGPGSADRPPTPLLAPRDATRVAMVYRRRLREPDRPSIRRIAALVGTLLVHLLVIVFIILGPAYELQEYPPPPEPTGDAIQLRLIERNPPPKPPAKPTPRGEAARAAPRKAKSAATGQVAAARSRRSAPMPPIATPDAPSVAVAPDTHVRSPVPNHVSTPQAPRKPPTAPPKQEELPPVPQPELPPPEFAATPPTPVVVPPKFQPEPVRPPREDGSQPPPPPPSIEMPPVPVAQSQVRPEPPTLAASTQVERPTTTVEPASVPRPEVTASAEPPSEALAPVPDVAERPAAPTITLATPRPTATIQVAPASIPQPAPAEEPDLAPVDVSADTRPSVQAPSTRVNAQVASVAGVARPEIGRIAAVPATAVEAGASEAKGEAATPEPPAGTGDRSAARDTTPTPGSPTGQANLPTPEAAAGTGKAESPSSANANGSAEGKTGLGGQAPGAATGSILGKPGPGGAEGAMNGNPAGNPGQFIQLKPRGDTQIMSHDTNPVKYKATRFAKDWTPEGESSIDTALRHAVEKTTLSHTFHLPRGVRVECKVMPLLPMALFGCGNPDPPAAALGEKVYERMKLAPSNPLVADLGAPVWASSTPAPAKPLDNSTLCATARVAGGPPPPGCTFDTPGRPSSPPPGSWVPASDQFH